MKKTIWPNSKKAVSRDTLNPKIWEQDSIRREVKKLLYPASGTCGKNASHLYEMIEKFPYIEEIHLVDNERGHSLSKTVKVLRESFYSLVSYSRDNMPEQDGLILVFRNPITSKEINVYYHRYDYLSLHKIPGLEEGADITFVNRAGFAGELTRERDKNILFYRRVFEHTKGFIYVTHAFLPQDKALIEKLEAISYDLLKDIHGIYESVWEREPIDIMEYVILRKRKEPQPTPDETGILFVPTHDKVLDFINGDEYLLICAADDDRTANAWEASKMGIPYKSDEANWVVEAEKKGCDWSLLHPRWQVEKISRQFIPGPLPIMTVDNFIPKESSKNRPIILTICFDYFASLDRTVIHFDRHTSKMGRHYPSEDEIFEQARILAECLEDNGIVPDKIICAESRNCVPKEYIPVIRKAINEAFRRPKSRKNTGIITFSNIQKILTSVEGLLQRSNDI
jgi:hypothetical protein